MSNSDWRYTKIKPCPKCGKLPVFDADESVLRCDCRSVYYSAGTLDELVAGWNEYTENPFEMELDKAVREHVEGVRNESRREDSE